VDIIRIEFSLGSVITNTTDRYGPIITVGGVSGVGGDFSHIANDPRQEGSLVTNGDLHTVSHK